MTTHHAPLTTKRNYDAPARPGLAARPEPDARQHRRDLDSFRKMPRINYPKCNKKTPCLMGKESFRGVGGGWPRVVR